MGDYDVPMRKLEKAMATHSSTSAWKIPWMEEPGGLQSMGLRRLGKDWATSLSLSCIGEGNGNSLQCSCLENPKEGGAWWAAIYGVAQSQTRLKRLSSSSSSMHKLSVVTNEPLLMRMSIMGEAIHVWRWGYMGNLYTFPSILLGI